MIFRLLKFMFSIPRSGTPTHVARFTEITSYTIYLTLGVLFLCFPVVPRVILMLPQFEGRAEGYLRIVGLDISIITFLFVITSRANLRTPGQGNLLFSIVTRLLTVPLVLVFLYVRDMVSLLFVMGFSVIDGGLALITFVLWWRETDGASFGKFFCEIWQILFVYKDGEMRKSSIAVVVNGIFYILLGGVVMIRPDLLQAALNLDTFKAFSGGYLASSFLAVYIHGTQYLFNGRTDYLKFNVSVVFYRCLLKIPVLILLWACSRIEWTLCLALCLVEGVGSLVIFVLLIAERRDIAPERKPIVSNKELENVTK